MTEVFPFRNPFQTFEQELFKGGVISHESFVREPGIAQIPFLEKSLELPEMLFDEDVQGSDEFFVRQRFQRFEIGFIHSSDPVMGEELSVRSSAAGSERTSDAHRDPTSPGVASGRRQAEQGRGGVRKTSGNQMVVQI